MIARSRKGRRQTGERPDYRFSLANERTFLAWIRTALALVAGAVVVHEFGTSLEPAVRMGLALLMLVCGGVLGGSAFSRWQAVDEAMRNKADLPHGRMPLFLGVLVPVTAAGLFLVLLFT